MKCWERDRVSIEDAFPCVSCICESERERIKCAKKQGALLEGHCEGVRFIEKEKMSKLFILKRCFLSKKNNV